MTLLLGGSLLLVAASAVALLMGWANANESFIWGSIGATILAAVLLAIAFFRSRSQATAAAAASPPDRGAPIDPEILADRDERSEQKYERAKSRGDEDAGAAGETQVLEGQPGAAAATAGAGAGGGAAAAATATPTVGPPAGGAESGEVVAVPKTKKFHRPDCRFASAQATETIDRAEADERGFDPCGVCKP